MRRAGKKTKSFLKFAPSSVHFTIEREDLVPVINKIKRRGFRVVNRLEKAKERHS